MRFLEFIHKVDEAVLLEAARDRYMQMFSVIPPEVLDAADANDSATLQAKIASTMALYQRSDRITWALRLIKHGILLKAREKAIQTLNGNVQISDEYRAQAEQVLNYVNGQELRLVKKSGMADHNLSDAAVNYPRAEQRMEHFLSLPIDGCLLYTSPSPRDRTRSRMPSSA